MGDGEDMKRNSGCRELILRERCRRYSEEHNYASPMHSIAAPMHFAAPRAPLTRCQSICVNINVICYPRLTGY